jgi:hypothetical protein
MPAERFAELLAAHNGGEEPILQDYLD